MNIRIEKHHIYESLPTVMCDYQVLFYCFHQEWAEELLNQVREIVEKSSIKSISELEGNTEFINLKDSYELKKTNITHH